MKETTPIALTPSDIKRFWSKVDIQEPDDCWRWQGSRRSSGYGQMWVNVDSGKNYSTHRIAHAITHGDTTKIILHKCNNPICCNPRHLVSGTHKENTQQMIREGRKKQPRGERHGNAKLTEDNIHTIRRLRSYGSTYKELVAEFGVSKGCIADVITGRSWSHVQSEVVGDRK